MDAPHVHPTAVLLHAIGAARRPRRGQSFHFDNWPLARAAHPTYFLRPSRTQQCLANTVALSRATPIRVGIQWRAESATGVADP